MTFLMFTIIDLKKCLISGFKYSQKENYKPYTHEMINNNKIAYKKF